MRRFGPGTPVIFDVKCSEVLPHGARERRARSPVMWKTGHSLIKAKMKEVHAPLAGEMSGHMFFGGDYFGFDDALFAAARLLEIVSRPSMRAGRALLADLPKTYATPEIRVDAPEEEKFAIVERAADAFRRPLPGEHHRRRAHDVPQRLGAAPRLQHPADPGAALRGHRPGRARRLPRRGRRAGSPNKACASSP